MKKRNNKSVKQDYLIKARLLLYNKYTNDLTKKYNILKIEEILSNSKSRIVSSFKDYLLFEDSSEFFRRYYNGKESFLRIKNLSHNINKNNLIYPNYASLEEGKYVLSNILRKQMLFNKQKINKYKCVSNHNIREKFFYKKNKIFNNDIYDDILAEQKSQSFINSLFGIDDKNKEQSEINEKEELNKIIKMIEINENLYLKKPDDKISVNVSMSSMNKTIYNYNKIINRQLNNDRKYSNNNISDKGKYKLNIENIFNEETNDDSITILNNNVNPKLYNNKKIIYHRKVKSSLSGNMTKIDLHLKIPNQNLNTSKNGIKISKIILSKSKIDIIEDKIENTKFPKEKKEDNIKSHYIVKITNNLNKISRNNQNNKIYKNTSIINNVNKSVYMKSIILKPNVKNRNLFSSMNNNYKIQNDKSTKRKFVKPYSKPKCIYKEIKSKVVSNKRYYYKPNEVIYIERIK